jgi:hypothetical protein
MPQLRGNEPILGLNSTKNTPVDMIVFQAKALEVHEKLG